MERNIPSWGLRYFQDNEFFQCVLVYKTQYTYKWRTREITGQYDAWSSVKVPRISDEVLKCCVYLDETQHEKVPPDSTKATGFLVGIPTFTRPYVHTYIVTAAHYIYDKSPYDTVSVSLNEKRWCDSMPLPKIKWTRHPEVDIAAIPYEIPPQFDYRMVIPTQFVTHEIIAQYNIGIGDDTFEAGRLNEREGKQYITPSVRLGNICMMGNDQSDEFLAELHSGSGYSGSPVFVYKTGSPTIPFPDDKLNASYKEPQGPWLLGVHVGHYEIPLTLRKASDHTKDAPGMDKVRSISHSGVSTVVPAWRIIELLKMPSLVEQRKRLALKWDQQGTNYPVNDFDNPLDLGEYDE